MLLGAYMYGRILRECQTAMALNEKKCISYVWVDKKATIDKRMSHLLLRSKFMAFMKFSKLDRMQKTALLM